MVDNDGQVSLEQQVNMLLQQNEELVNNLAREQDKVARPARTCSSRCSTPGR